MEAGAEAELLTGRNLLGLLQGAVQPEEKVSQLFELLREPVYHYLLVIFRSSAEAEDITQETFLHLYQHLQDGQPVDNPRFWIFRVAHNLAINRQKREEMSELLDDPSWDQIRDRMADSALDPEERLLEREKLQRLHAAMAC